MAACLTRTSTIPLGSSRTAVSVTHTGRGGNSCADGADTSTILRLHRRDMATKTHAHATKHTHQKGHTNDNESFGAESIPSQTEGRSAPHTARRTAAVPLWAPPSNAVASHLHAGDFCVRCPPTRQTHMAEAYVSSASFLGIVSRKQAWSFAITSLTVSTTFCIWAAVGASALPVFCCVSYRPARKP